MAAARSGLFVALFGLLCAGVLCAQQPATKSTAKAAYKPSMTFDVASVRETNPDLQAGFSVSFKNPAHSSLIRLANNTIDNLLEIAYDVNPHQVVGLPDWTRGVGPFFNIEAKSDQSADERLAKLSDEQARLEKQHMIQELLANRFHLKVHWEAREGPIYDLVVAKNGPKLHPSGSMPPSAEELHDFGDSKTPSLYQRGNGIKGYEYVCHGCSLESLSEALAAQMGEPVVNKTGLTGTYDFLLQYNGRGPEASDDPAVWPPLLTAVPDELGLKMQPAKGDRRFLVIDHIERPSAN